MSWCGFLTCEGPPEVEKELEAAREALARVEKVRQVMAICGAMHWCSELAKALHMGEPETTDEDERCAFHAAGNEGPCSHCEESE